MIFNSYEFIFIFLPFFIAAYYLLPTRLRIAVITIASYVFYAAWNSKFVFLLLGVTLVNYIFGKSIHGASTTGKRKLLCGASVAFNLGVLACFKYLGLFEDTINALAGHQVVASLRLVLPVGISFYLFQCMSYTIEIYRKSAHPSRNFLDFACYVSLFPHLVAGPILRYSFMEKQFVEREHSKNRFLEGIGFFIVGLAKKVLIADTLGTAATSLFSGHAGGTYAAWASTVAFSLQIFYDFSGYSDMAVGLGRIMGFTIPQNFNSPYLAQSMSEFWRRWHMSLSYWLRDFLYIPLGGSRKGEFNRYRNLMITMFLCGLWHGASWLFVMWGCYHGALLCIERLLGERNPVRKLPAALQILTTNFLVMMGWVLFRSDSLSTATRVYRNLFTAGDGSATAFMIAPAFIATLLAAVAFTIKGENIYDRKWNFTPAWALLFLGILVVCAATVFSRDFAPFIYFQF